LAKKSKEEVARGGRFRALIWLAVLLACTHAAMGWAGDIRVLSTPTLKSALHELAPAFEQQTGHRLVTRFDNAATLKRQVEAGEPFDVIILLPAQVDDLIGQGRVIAGTRTDIAKAMVGMAMRTDLPPSDISTVDAVKKALLGVHSLSWSPESASGAYLVGLLDRLGIAQTVKPRLVPVPGGEVVDAVAKGLADATVITAPNIVDIQGVRLVGLLPRELQHETIYAAGVGTRSADAEASRSLIRYLMEPGATTVLHNKGLERASP
jgi:molybdate transport system substrate-binding protein